jgi:hypothetical protein
MLSIIRKRNDGGKKNAEIKTLASIMIRIALFPHFVRYGRNIPFALYAKAIRLARKGGPHIGKRDFCRVRHNNPVAVLNEDNLAALFDD